MRVTHLLLAATLATSLPAFAQHEGHGGSGMRMGTMEPVNTGSMQMSSMFALQANTSQAARYRALIATLSIAKQHAERLADSPIHTASPDMVEEHSGQLLEAFAAVEKAEELLEVELNTAQASAFKKSIRDAEKLHLEIDRNLWALDQQLAAGTFNTKLMAKHGRKVEAAIMKLDKTMRKVGAEMGVES